MDNKANMSLFGRRFIVTFLLVIVIIGIWYLFFRINEAGPDKATKLIVGEWIRTDGPYTIKIIEVLEEGKLNAAYLNPGPINVGRSGWRIRNEKLQVYVELQDKNYPGSFYELNYNEEMDELSGTYFQAPTKQSYDVILKRK